MAHEESYTTEELAQLLKVSKLTIYDLIKKGELTAYRVGRQMRVDQSALDAYKQRSQRHHNLKEKASDHETGANNVANQLRSVVISGQDPCLDILARELDAKGAYRSLRSHQGSLDSLIAMYHGKADIVSTHLFDGDTGTYNIPYIRKLLVSKAFVVLHLISRTAGIYVAKDNPLGINDWRDLAQENVRIVNREPGAGARVLLDEQLRLADIPRAAVKGYDQEQTSHLSIASMVASGRADAGIGIEQTAKLAGITFLPMRTESYDLVLLRTEANKQLIADIQMLLKRKTLQDELASLGYDIAGMGDILYEQ